MENKTVNKTVRVSSLNEEQQKEIEDKLRKEISDVMSGQEEIEDTVQHGMDGRISDLEGSIDIYNLDKTKLK